MLAAREKVGASQASANLKVVHAFFSLFLFVSTESIFFQIIVFNYFSEKTFKGMRTNAK